jgi:CTP synthase
VRLECVDSEIFETPGAVYRLEGVHGILIRSLYGGVPVIEERLRHRYKVSVNFRAQLEATGLRFSGMSPDGVLPEIVELPGHPWFVGVQYHPELKSKPFAPHPLFAGFIAAAVRQARLV